MRDWLLENRQWVFSGIGVMVISALWWILRRLFGSRPQQAPTTINVSPTTTVAVTQQSVVAPTQRLKTSGILHEDGDLRPELYSLPPRICFVTPSDDGRFAESEEDTGMRAVIATFRMKRRSADGRSTFVTARLSYRAKANVGFSGIVNDICRVNYGLWIDEDFNAAEMTLSATRELILVLADEKGKCLAVQDNRHGANKWGEPTIYKLDSGMDTSYVYVTLVDDEHGDVISYSYRIGTDPLRVHEMIRV
jgi:hypothetical protein